MTTRLSFCWPPAAPADICSRPRRSASELIKRGLRVRLVTDARALHYSGLFTTACIDVVPSETVRGRSPVALARTVVMLVTARW